MILHYKNQRSFHNNALYCVIESSTVLKVYSNADLTFTGEVLITFSTNSFPSSSTFTFELYDKYKSSSDYGRSVVVSTSITNNPSGVTILPSTNVDWRRMAYRQRRTDASAFRVTAKNNYPYVTVYSTSSNSVNYTASNAIIFRMPNTHSSSQKFRCIAR